MSEVQVTMRAQSSNQLKTRLSRALFELNLKLASCKSGALVQVWMPEITADGGVVLSAQGLPFAIAGVGDLLALFRCVSCRYRFSTDITRPALMGAIGRVYSSCEPEMSHNVQKYDKQVYLRVSEAQRCRVHSTLVMPVFDAGDDGAGGRPIAVFELVQADRDVAFPAVIAELRKCLTEVAMSTSEPDSITTSVGLRNWPMHIESSALLRELGEELGRMQPQQSLSNSAGRLLLENDAPDDETSPAGPSGIPASEAAAGGNPAGQARPASSFVSAWVQQAPAGTAGAQAAGSPGSLLAGAGGSSAATAAAAVAAGIKPDPHATSRGAEGAGAGSGSGTPGSGQGSAEVAGEATAAAAGARQAGSPAERAAAAATARAAAAAAADDDMAVDQAPLAGKRAAQSGSREEGGGDTDEAQSKQSLPGAATAATAGKAQQQQQQLKQQAAQPAKDSSSPKEVATTQAMSVQQQEPQQQQQQQSPLDLNSLLVNSMQALLNQHSQALQASTQQQQQQGSGGGQPDPAALSSAISTLMAAANSPQGNNSNQQPLLASLQQLQQLQQQLLAAQQQQQQGGQKDVNMMAAPANQQQMQMAMQLQQIQALTGLPQQQQQQQLQQLQQQQQLMMLQQQQQQQQMFMQPPLPQQQQQLRRNNSSMVNLARPAATAGGGEEGEEEEELFGSDDDEDGASRMHSGSGFRSGASSANRPMGTGRKLTFEDLQAQFGLGLKEAAANLGICATTLKRACRRNGITRWPRRQIQKLNRALTQMGPQQASGQPLDELVHSAIRKNLKPSMLTPAVTASLQQHLMVQSGQGHQQQQLSQRSSSVAIPRAGSGPMRHGGSNSGSFTGCAGSLGDATTLAGTCGSGGQLGGFAGFSFPGADGQLTASLPGGCGDLTLQQQQQVQQQLQVQAHMMGLDQVPGAPGGMMVSALGVPGCGSYQALMAGAAGPGQDLQQQQEHHQRMLQQQAVIASSQQQLLLLQHQHQQLSSLAASGVPGLGAGMGMGLAAQQQQQQMLMRDGMRAEQQQGLMAAAAGSPGTGNNNLAGPEGAALGQAVMLPLLGSPGSSAAAGVTLAPAMPAGGSSHVTDGSSHGTQQEQQQSQPQQRQQQQQQQQLLQGLEAPGEGFFDLLSDDMLLDDAGLDMSLASFEGGGAAAASTGAAAAAAVGGAGGASDYDPAKEFTGFQF